jgi:hypothetical protein
VVFVGGMEFVGLWGVVVLGHAGSSFRVGLVRWMRMRGGGMYWEGGLCCRAWFDRTPLIAGDCDEWDTLR